MSCWTYAQRANRESKTPNATVYRDGVTAAPSTADVLAELRAFVDEALPQGWIDAAERDDHRWLRATLKATGIRGIIAKVGDAGWVAPHWPVEHGGRALPDEVARAVLAQLDDWSVPRTPRGAGFVLAAPALRQYASDETQRRFLPKLASGEEVWCQLFSEPGAGSDLAALAGSAVRDGDCWIVTGRASGLGLCFERSTFHVTPASL